MSTYIEHLKERIAQHLSKDRLLAIKDKRRIAGPTPVEIKSLYAVFIMRIEYTKNM